MELPWDARKSVILAVDPIFI
ncbi:hypothetical protein CP8484711_0610A, partial [Chlamydia psittaci 84-8471/1]